MLGGWKIGTGRLFGEKGQQAPGAPQPSPPHSSTPPVSSPVLTAQSAKIVGAAGTMPSVVLLPPASDSSQPKSGILSSVLNAISSYSHGKQIPQSKEDLEFERLKNTFTTYSTRVTNLLAAVEASQQAVIQLAQCLVGVTTAIDLLGQPLEGEEGSLSGHRHESLNLEAVAPIIKDIQKQYTEKLIIPLQTVISSHRELQNRIRTRDRHKQEYEKASKAFQALQKKAVKTSRKAGNRKLGGTDGTITNKFSAAFSKFTGATGGPPENGLSLSTSFRRAEDSDEDEDVEDRAEREAEDAGSVGDLADTVLEEGVKSLESPTRPSHNKQTVKRADAASKLAALYTATSSLTEALGEELQHSVSRREIIYRGVAASAWHVHAISTDSLASSFQGDSAAAADHDVSVIQVAWYDEGAAARAVKQAQTVAKKERQRRHLETEGILRAVPLHQATPGVPLTLSEPAPAKTAVLQSPLWLAHLASYTSLQDVVHLAGSCRALHSACLCTPDVILAAMRQRRQFGDLGAQVASFSCKDYGRFTIQQQAALQASAKSRYVYWRRALAADGKPLPPWSALRSESAVNVRASASFSPVSPDGFRALVRLAEAESAKGGKQDDKALSDGDLVYVDDEAGTAECRWANLIEQDVLRSYGEGRAFGYNSAVARSCVRLGETNDAHSESDTGDYTFTTDDSTRRQRLLKDILLATAASEPSLRYTQGMSSIARMLLEVCLCAGIPDEQAKVDAFNMFGGLLRLGAKMPHVPGEQAGFEQCPRSLGALFGHDSKMLSLKLFQADWLLGRFLPDAARALSKEKLTPSAYASGWFLTLFSNFSCLPVADALAVWDRFFVGGWPEIMDAYLDVMATIEDHLEHTCMEDQLQVLQAPLAYFYDKGGPPHSIFIPGTVAERVEALAHLEHRFGAQETIPSSR